MNTLSFKNNKLLGKGKCKVNLYSAAFARKQQCRFRHRQGRRSD